MKRMLVLVNIIFMIVFSTTAQMISVTETSKVVSDAYVGYCDPNSPPNSCFGGSVSVQAFNQNGIWITDTHVFAVYWDADKHLTLARRHLSGGGWVKIKFSDVLKTVDSHRTPGVAVSPEDGTIHLAFGHHIDTLMYRISNLKGAVVPDAEFNEALFTGTRNQLRMGDILTRFTYPTFISGAGNKLLMFWRFGGSGNGDTYLSEYTSDNGWGPKIQVISGQGSYNTSLTRNAYWNDIIVKEGRIHLSWCWRESKMGTYFNHDLNYAYSDDNGKTWYSDKGILAAKSDSLVINVNTAGIVAWPVRGYNMANNCGETVDGAGRVHTVLRFETSPGSKKNTYYHIWKNPGKGWNKTQLNFPASIKSFGRPKIFADTNDNTIYIVGVVDRKITVYAAKEAESFERWYQVYSGLIDYFQDINGLIKQAGNLSLYVYAQRMPATPTAISSGIDLLQFELKSGFSTVGLPVLPLAVN